MERFQDSTYKLPVVLIIDDLGDNVFTAEFQETYKNKAYIFTLNGAEFRQFYKYKDYTEFTSWCEEFANMVREIDKQLVEREVQNRRQLPPAIRSGSAQTQMRGESPVRRNDDRRMEDDEYGRGRESSFDRAARHAYEDSQRDETYRRRLWEDEEKQRRMRENAERDREMERKARRMEEERRFRMERDMDADRGHRGRDWERSESNSPILPQVSQEQDSARESPSSTFEDDSPDVKIVKAALEHCKANGSISSKENTLATFFHSPVLFKILKTGLGSIQNDVLLLDLLCQLVKTTNPEAVDKAEEIVIACLEEKFLLNIIYEYCEPALHCEKYWTENLYFVFKYLMTFFDHVTFLFPNTSPEYVYENWKSYLDTLNNVPDEFWDRCDAHAYNILISMSVEINSRYEKKYHEAEAERAEEFFRRQESRSTGGRSLTPPPPPRTYERPKIDVKPLWMECESIEPPSSFRQLSEFPIKRDIYKPEKPYIRRVKEDGIYENSEHYLDIQFRLLREDMISPLRDGLALYKHYRCYRNNPMERGRDKDPYEDSAISDLSLFKVVKVEGIQVRPNIGIEFRYVHLDDQSVQSALVGRYLRFGQMVCLSDDGFVEDMHIGTIVERDDNIMERDKYIGIAFIEDDTLKKDNPYVMVEPNSYLEAYLHVLKVLKETSRFSPIPFERYLIHGKKDVRRPLYTRIPNNNEFEEDKAIYEFYEKARTDAKAELNKKRKEKRDLKKGKKDRHSPVERSSTPSDSDDEIERELKNPLHKVAIGAFTAQTRNRIMLKGLPYQLDRLEEDYQDGGLDASQLKALTTGLTHELAIIQGPPGTGKTFIGVEIVDAILHNRTHWGLTTPILVVCYTNQALDQFLEKIYQKIIQMEDFTDERPSIVRLGTKCESSYIMDSGLMKKDMVDKYKCLSGPKGGKDGKGFGIAQKDKKLAQQELLTTSYAMSAIYKEILSYEMLKQVMSTHHLQDFSSWKKSHRDSNGVALNDDETLACWLLNKEFTAAKRPDLPPTEESPDSDEDEKLMMEEMALEQVEVKEMAPEKKYYIEGDWDLARQNNGRAWRNAAIFNKRTKADPNSKSQRIKEEGVAVFELARFYGLECSLFERLVKNDFPFVTLETQHRMHPVMTQHIVRPYFYNSMRDHESVNRYPCVKGMGERLFFWSHNASETPLDSTSRKNDTEVAMVMSLLDYLMKQGYEKRQITVIATYSAQTSVLRRFVGDQFGTNEDSKRPLIAVETCDSFQGKGKKTYLFLL
ncbi:hypothetical protein WR25_24809 isoform D [Diploscapter pachys]|nr:hypothetical protein WR25_24809 isoform B [Diploscapter pachys]PAV90133.1 hypothetical protein WR25_24809 isoform C [Diploscapter pachys]PAV90134.1 hypothetical protein WR25_24809 isoform D [Diploscapter pachys]